MQTCTEANACIIKSRPIGWGHYTLMDVVCPSVCLSVPDPKSRIEGRSKLKIVRKEA